MNKSTAAVWIVALVLFANACLSFQKTQAKTSLTPEARNAELLKYTGGPLVSGLVTLAGWFGGRKLVAGDGSLSLTSGILSLLKPSKRTVIAIDEPNIKLRITLTGDAATETEGRRRIGSVTQWYGGDKSPASLANDSADVGTVVAEGGAA